MECVLNGWPFGREMEAVSEQGEVLDMPLSNAILRLIFMTLFRLFVCVSFLGSNASRKH